MTVSIVASLYQIKAIRFGNFKLKGGEETPIYINLRKIVSYPTLLQQTATKLWEKVKTCQYDLICGVPYTALPMTTCISLNYNIPMIMRRKEKKTYGTKQMIEGEFTRGQTCLVIEDVVTTGNSIMETIKDLESSGLQVKDCVALIDREPLKPKSLTDKYNFHACFSLNEILTTLIQLNVMTASEKSIVSNFINPRCIK